MVHPTVQENRQKIFNAAYRYYLSGGLPAYVGNFGESSGAACRYFIPENGARCAIGASLISLGCDIRQIPDIREVRKSAKDFLTEIPKHNLTVPEEFYDVDDHNSSGFLGDLQRAHDIPMIDTEGIPGVLLLQSLEEFAQLWDLSIPTD